MAARVRRLYPVSRRSRMDLAYMIDKPFTTPGRRLPERQPRPGEVLFEFLRGHDRFQCELRDHGKYGVEAQFYRNEEFSHSWRFDTRDEALLWAEHERQAIEKGGV